ncbi:hypothetical protein Tco_1176116 [Tanacetum coccineum]
MHSTMRISNMALPPREARQKHTISQVNEDVDGAPGMIRVLKAILDLDTPGTLQFFSWEELGANEIERTPILHNRFRDPFLGCAIVDSLIVLLEESST